MIYTIDYDENFDEQIKKLESTLREGEEIINVVLNGAKATVITKEVQEPKTEGKKLLLDSVRY